MSISVSALELDAFDRLPLHSRRCVFWEVDAASDEGLDVLLAGPTEGYESEFDKEAWLSGLLLEWGSCCQLAVESTNDRPVGSAFYGPANRVPRSRRFPTAPVSADAVLLSTINVEPGFEEAAPLLLDAVISDLARRGVRAIEAFGFTECGEDLARDLVSLVLGAGIAGNVCHRCLMSTEFLLDAGFEIVAPDQYLPRLRLELDEGLGWKTQVEYALQKLVEQTSAELKPSKVG